MYGIKVNHGRMHYRFIKCSYFTNSRGLSPKCVVLAQGRSAIKTEPKCILLGIRLSHNNELEQSSSRTLALSATNAWRCWESQKTGTDDPLPPTTQLQHYTDKQRRDVLCLPLDAALLGIFCLIWDCFCFVMKWSAGESGEIFTQSRAKMPCFKRKPDSMQITWSSCSGGREVPHAQCLKCNDWRVYPSWLSQLPISQIILKSI